MKVIGQDFTRGLEREYRDMAQSREWRMIVSNGFLLLFANQALLEFLGHTQDEVVGGSWLGLIHRDDLPVLMLLFWNAVEKRKRLTVKFRIENKEGDYVRCLLKVEPRENGDGYVGALRLCTRRRNGSGAPRE